MIADQARVRRDLQPLRAGGEISTGLRTLTARRAGKSADRVRAINRLQAQAAVDAAKSQHTTVPAPAPRDSGRITGNHHHRPRRYDRRLLRVFYFSGLSALKSCSASRTYYDRKTQRR